MGDAAHLINIYKHLTGEDSNICRLCLDAVDVNTGVNLEESYVIETFYCDDTVTYAEMLSALGVCSDFTLPRLLCKHCADLIMKAFCFHKLSQYSYNKWYEALDKLEQTDSLDFIKKETKTAYIVIQKENTHVLTGTKSYKCKKVLIGKIKRMIWDRRASEKIRSKLTICNECGIKIKYSSLAAHIRRVHSKDLFQCSSCNKLFNDAVKLHDHKMIMHMPKTIPCEHCNKKFSTEKLLRTHHLKFHIPATCNVCSVEFPSRVAMRKHSDEHRLILCIRCNKVFEHRTGLQQHQVTCRDVPLTFICDICNKSFIKRRLIIQHMRVVHGFSKTYDCRWCGKKYDAISRVKMHEVKHTRERNFSCHVCGNVFVTKAALQYHMRIHTGEKPFPCDICGEKFLSASRRMDHMKRKHLEPTYHVCSVCGNKFKCKSGLVRHFKRHTNPGSKMYVPDIVDKDNKS